jgi:rubrerythrin
LLVEALAAAGDEARHAEQSLALASRFAGRRLELGALVVEGALHDIDDLASALRAAVLEGCIDETLAAHEAACLAARAEDPQVASVLEQIASDEARHAALAWKFVAWVIGERPQLRPVVVEALASVAMPELPELDESNALGFGCPSARLRARWRGVGLRELVEPCAARLLEANHTRLSV